MSRDIKSVITYYSIALAILYIPYLIIPLNSSLRSSLSRNPYLVLGINVAYLILLTAIAYSILKLIYGVHEGLMSGN